MPAFTHMLGPVVDAGDGKPQTRLTRRLSIVRDLIDQLPSSSYFHQHLDPSLDDGLALADGLAFQQHNFAVSTQYTFEIDCRKGSDEMWAALYLKTRQHIRRAEREYSVREVGDPKSFIEFYLKNLKAAGRVNRIDFSRFSALFSEASTRKSATILAAFWNDVPVAMTFLVWGHGTMYYLLSTRAVDGQDHGTVSLLIWKAMLRAHELGMILDLDGVYTGGTVRFLSNFGGTIKARIIVRKSRMPYTMLQHTRRLFAPDESYRFT
jgi:lipid II:glycine glycyltransferase (peptidoglycan interpeptide bridge formation enzyme)